MGYYTFIDPAIYRMVEETPSTNKPCRPTEYLGKVWEPLTDSERIDMLDKLRGRFPEAVKVLEFADDYKYVSEELAHVELFAQANPEWLIELAGDGESSDDKWIEWYQGTRRWSWCFEWVTFDPTKYEVLNQ